MPRTFYCRWGKRVFDLAVASVALAVFAPVLLLVAAAVAVVMGRPVLFKQQRPGLGGRLFTLYKFRTMSSARDSAGNVLSDESRLTWLGRLLRSTSLDELPELWNVLRGEMSLVGPRPLLAEYLGRYSPYQMRRHDVRPGLTGWAQVHGRNAVAWQTRLDLDVWYTEHMSFRLDLQIIAHTVWQVVSCAGVSAAGHATMPRFTSSAEPDTAARAPLGFGTIVIGAGGHAKVVIAALRAAGKPIAAVFDDNPQMWGQKLLGVEVRGPLAELANYEGRGAVIAIGDNQARRRIAERLKLDWKAVIHPTAHVDPTAAIAPGAVIMARAVVQVDAHIEAHAIVNTGATVDHDCRIGPFVHLAPGVHLAGNVCVDEGAFLGIGAAVIPNRSIGENTVVGAGSTVIHNLRADVVAVGSPARVIKFRQGQQAA